MDGRPGCRAPAFSATNFSTSPALGVLQGVTAGDVAPTLWSPGGLCAEHTQRELSKFLFNPSATMGAKIIICQSSFKLTFIGLVCKGLSQWSL